MERIVTVGKEEVPVLNVMCIEVDYDNNTSIKEDGDNRFAIDVYTGSNSTTNENGDTLSNLKLSRIMGLVRSILESPKFITLLFPRPFIKRTKVEKIQFAGYQNNQDASNVVWGRLTFRVDCIEIETEQFLTKLLEGYDTVVKIDETDKGYQYTAEST